MIAEGKNQGGGAEQTRKWKALGGLGPDRGMQQQALKMMFVANIPLQNFKGFC